MTASLIFDAPLGSLVAYSDNQPKPPARFTKKLAAWKSRNGVGRLIRKEPARERPTYTSPPSLTLHEGDFGKDLKLDNKWAYNIIKQVGNYSEIFERNVGSESPLKIKRGQNNLWNNGGIQYAPPVR